MKKILASLCILAGSEAALAVRPGNISIPETHSEFTACRNTPLSVGSQVPDFMQFMGDIFQQFPVDNFEDFFQKFEGSNPCLADRGTVERDAIRIMKKALEQAGVPASQRPNLRSIPGFSDQMKALWTALLPDGGGTSVRSDIERALHGGIIPLPVWNDEIEIASGKKLNVFTLTAMEQIFFLGVAPVTLRHHSAQELDSRREHPLLREFFESTAKLTQHDLGHARLIGEVKTNLMGNGSSQYPTGCLQYHRCFHKILERFSHLSKEERITNRLALYYLLHEEGGASSSFSRPEWRSSQTSWAVDPQSLGEFALERVMNSPQFNHSTFFLKHTPRDLAACRFLESKVTSFVPKILLTQIRFTQGAVVEQILEAFQNRQKDQSAASFTQSRHFFDELKFRGQIGQALVENMTTSCKARFTEEQLKRPEEEATGAHDAADAYERDVEQGKTDLERNFEAFNQGIAPAYQEEIERLLISLDRIQELYRVLPECRAPASP